MNTRREFLKKAAMISGLSATSAFVPESIQRALAIEPEHGSSYQDAEHIVILMQENRSFDHVFGSLAGVRGFNDPRAMRQPNGNTVFLQSDAAGKTYAPWRMDIKNTKATWMGFLPHERQTQVDAWNQGCNDRWIEAKRPWNPQYAHIPLTMGHYTREDLPFYYALADAFTVCDQHYSGAMTSTTPNRSLFWTGTVRDQQNTTTSKVYMRNVQLGVGGMKWKTYPERLQEAGISWKFYQNELNHAAGMTQEERQWLANFGCNILEMFSAYRVQLTKENAAALPERVANLTKQIEELESRRGKADERANRIVENKLWELRKQLESSSEDLAVLTSGGFAHLGQAARMLHQQAFVTNSGDPDFRSLETITFSEHGTTSEMKVPKGDLLHQFRKDVDSGKLPAVSWLVAPEKFCDHPTSPWYGAWYVSEVMDILTKNPDVWKKTIFILTYDENDGYFDHGVSFTAPDPKRPETGRASKGIDTGMEYMYVEDELKQGVPIKDARNGPIGLGFRVPLIVASPWSRGGWVNSQIFDHTSTLQFLERFIQAKYAKDVHEPQISAFRRAICGDLTSVFRTYDANEKKLPFLKRDPFVTEIQKARNKQIPANFITLSPTEIENSNGRPDAANIIPSQEPGIRPANALPYELYADGKETSSGFEITLSAGTKVHGDRSSGVPYNVYLRNTVSAPTTSQPGSPGMTVATYIVSAGDTLTQAFPFSLFKDGQYEIEVLGPNGFYRRFTGTSALSEIRVGATYESEGLSVKIRNTSAKARTVLLRDNSYRSNPVKRTIAPGAEASVSLPLGKQHGWYDFTVTVAGAASDIQYAGRVENGKSTYTDPRMGRV